MANSLDTAFNPEYWSKRMQIIRFKKSVYSVLANFEERANLSDGDVVHRPYRSTLLPQSYVKGTGVTIQDVSGTDESLTVDQAKVIPFYIDDIDRIQNKWDMASKFADDAGTELELLIDADFLAEVVNADSVVDDGSIGGTAGNPIALSTSNILSVFAVASKKLNQKNIGMENRYMVISPTVLQILTEYLAGKDSALGDSTGMNGHIGKFFGFDLYMSNNTYWTGTWTPANQPSDGDTITINGVTITFETGTIDTAGQVKSETSTAVTLDNLVAFLNAPGTSVSGKYMALSVADQKALLGLTATDATTAVTIAFQGGGEVDVAASEAADVWSATTAHIMAGQKGAVDVVVQKAPSVEFKEVPDKLGKNVLPWMLYGIKTFDEGDAALVDIKLDTEQF